MQSVYPVDDTRERVIRLEEKFSTLEKKIDSVDGKMNKVYDVIVKGQGIMIFLRIAGYGIVGIGGFIASKIAAFTFYR